jgi:HEAT repeat protein
MDEWGQQSDEHLATIEQTAAVIAIHNIYKHLWKIGEIPGGIDLPNFWIRLDREPLAFLLVLVDTLQNWDLPGFSPMQPPEELPVNCDIDLEPDAEKILLRYPYRAHEYTTTIQQLKNTLLPIQVDRWLAPLEHKRLPETPLASDSKLAGYNQKLINRLKDHEADPFIDSQILPVNLRMEPGKPGDRTYTIFEIAEQLAQKPVVLLGTAGIGKTTLVKHLAIHYAETGERVPVFIDLAFFSSVHSFEHQWLATLRQSIGETRLSRLLEDGKLVIIFDGFNEVNSEQRRNTARGIADFINTYARNQFFIACRPAEYPLISSDMRHFQVLPINQHEILDYLIKTLGSPAGKQLYANLSPVIRDLCRVPLILAMLVYIHKGTEDQQPRTLPVSKVALYREFLSQLFRREESLHASELPFWLREEFLTYIAQKMDNSQIAIKIQKAAEWIEEFYHRRYHDRDLGITLPTILHEVLHLPPLISPKPGPHIDGDISFMHQTFQEYYTARALLLALQQNNMTLKEIAACPLARLDAWWETLTLLVGMMDDATGLIRTIKEAAIDHKDHRLLRLVADCIGEAQRVSPSEVDCVILHIIFEFKYGVVTFDYDLIESLKAIKAEKRTREFPSRLIDDMEWWVAKYAKEQGVNLGNSISIETLLAYLASEDEVLVLNALSTLRGHPHRKAAAEQLAKQLHHTTGAVREQTIITLGYLEDNASLAVERLMTIMGNRAESDLARTHAAAALSRIGDVKAVESMLELVHDHTYRYRDTACWAPLRIAKLHPEERPLITRLKEGLMEDLLQEPDTKEGRYAKGNALYVLGELGAMEYAADIASWLQHQTEAYVIEDGIHTLGLIGGQAEVAIIRARLHHEDLAVRMVAAQALAALHKRVDLGLDLLADLQTLLKDKTVVVREYVAELLKTVYGEEARKPSRM